MFHLVIFSSWKRCEEKYHICCPLGKLMCRGFWDRWNSTPISLTDILGSHTFWEGKYTLYSTTKLGFNVGYDKFQLKYTMCCCIMYKNYLFKCLLNWRLGYGTKFLGVLNFMIIFQQVFAIVNWRKVVTVHTSANSSECAVYLLTFSCGNVQVKCGN